MWKDYSISYMKNNRASSVSVMAAAFISALLLSLLCSIFYNLWAYEVDRLKREEGDWQARLTGVSDRKTLDLIASYANVENLTVNTELFQGQQMVVDINFVNPGRILSDMPRIAELAGLPADAVSYHHSLLNLYLVRDPSDPAPRLIFPFFLAVTGMASCSLIMIIHNSFAVSMNARIHQFGILSSIGATPGQIRICLLQEAAGLCAVPIVTGNLLGILLSLGVIEGTNRMFSDMTTREAAVWSYHPLIFLASFLVTFVTIWISAWIPARKMSRLTPLEAIRNTGELGLKRKRNSYVLSLLFGVEGELAGNALKAQKKALRTALLALTFSFLAFTLMQCFFTLTVISQRMTYFERYQDAWDVMVTVKGTAIGEFDETEQMQRIPGVESGAVYQLAAAKRLLMQEELSEELQAMGGLQSAPGSYLSPYEGGWLVNVPMIILDDVSFLNYCRQIGAEPRTDGAVVINRIQDLTDSDFRHREYFPYLNGEGDVTVLRQAGQETVTTELPVLFYTQQLPVLREAFAEQDLCELVHVLPLSLWQEIGEQIGGAEENTYICILGEEEVSLADLNEMEEEISRILGEKYETAVENRIQDKIDNDAMIDGLKLVTGGFCVLLAIIGIGNVFSNALGFVRQRRREIARYLSIGLTPQGVRKMFCVEALMLAVRPVLITLPLTVIMVGLMLKASYLEPVIFIREAPVAPILAFFLAILGFVALAYYLGGKKVLHSSLVDALRDDTLF